MPAYMTIKSLLQRVHEKLDEARFFLQCMTDLEASLDGGDIQQIRQLRYYTSAFLNAVRSPLQYLLADWEMERESCDKCFRSSIAYERVRKLWYDSEVSKYPVLKFLRDERDWNIHVRPAQPMFRVDTYMRATPDGQPEIPSVTTCTQKWLLDGTEREVCEIGAEAITAVQRIIDDAKLAGFIELDSIES